MTRWGLVFRTFRHDESGTILASVPCRLNSYKIYYVKSLYQHIAAAVATAPVVTVTAPALRTAGVTGDVTVAAPT